MGYTFDAGPNAVLVCEEMDSEDVESALVSIFRVCGFVILKANSVGLAS